MANASAGKQPVVRDESIPQIASTKQSGLNLDGWMGITMTIQLKQREDGQKFAVVILLDVVWAEDCKNNTCVQDYTRDIALAIHQLTDNQSSLVEFIDYNRVRHGFILSDIEGFSIGVAKDIGVCTLQR